MKLSVSQSLRNARIATWSSSSFASPSATVVAAAATPAKAITTNTAGVGGSRAPYALDGLPALRERTPMR